MSDNQDIPKISVMIPTYEPSELLTQTLDSVLHQVDEPSKFQIAIVDDGSINVDIAKLLQPYLARHSIELYINKENLRLAGNWNRAIDLARGEIIHILHQDDLVKPGFYRRMIAAFEDHPDIGMAFCRHEYIDEAGNTEKISRYERRNAGRLKNWLRRITERTRLQCVAAVVRKSVYGHIGTYRSDLVYSLDWEMWVRIASRYPVWFEPGVMASYRRHPHSESERLNKNNIHAMDMIKTIDCFHMSPKQYGHVDLSAYAYCHLLNKTLRHIRKLYRRNEQDRALQLIPAATLAMQRLTKTDIPITLRWKIFLLKLNLQHWNRKLKP